MRLPYTLSAICALASTIEATPTTNADAAPIIYLIRHAEKNSDGTISSQGMKREQCLINLFGKNSNYQIGRIITPNPHNGKHVTQRPYNTTLPLAKSLGLNIHHSCEYDDMQCAADEAFRFKGPGNLLIAWEHVRLPTVAKDIGATNAPKYPDDRFDLIYQLPSPYDTVTLDYERCPGIDV